MKIETSCNIVEPRCSMIVRGLMGILFGKLFYFYIANFTAKPINLPIFMIVSSSLNISTCIIHARDEEPNMLRDNALIRTQYYKVNIDPTVNAVREELPGRGNKEGD